MLAFLECVPIKIAMSRLSPETSTLVWSKPLSSAALLLNFSQKNSEMHQKIKIYKLKTNNHRVKQENTPTSSRHHIICGGAKWSFWMFSCKVMQIKITNSLKQQRVLIKKPLFCDKFLIRRHCGDPTLRPAEIKITSLIAVQSTVRLALWLQPQKENTKKIGVHWRDFSNMSHLNVNFAINFVYCGGKFE